MCTKSSYTNSIGGSLFYSFTYSKRTGTGILGSCFQASICVKSYYREKESENRCKFQYQQKSIVVYVYKRANRQGLGTLKWFFLHFCLSETNLLPVNQQVRRLFHVHFHCTWQREIIIYGYTLIKKMQFRQMQLTIFPIICSYLIVTTPRMLYAIRT